MLPSAISPEGLYAKPLQPYELMQVPKGSIGYMGLFNAEIIKCIAADEWTTDQEKDVKQCGTDRYLTIAVLTAMGCTFVNATETATSISLGNAAGSSMVAPIPANVVEVSFVLSYADGATATYQEYYSGGWHVIETLVGITSATRKSYTLNPLTTEIKLNWSGASGSIVLDEITGYIP